MHLHARLCLAVFVSAFFSGASFAADPTPDELFPEDSKRSLEHLEMQMEIRRQQQAEDLERAAFDRVKEWAKPELASKPATYADLALLQKEIEQLRESKNKASGKTK